VEEAEVGTGASLCGLELANLFELPQPREEVVALEGGSQQAVVEGHFVVVEK
jgi:hypothetical protein